MINSLYTCLLFQARGLVLEALELLASYNHFTLSPTMINGLVTKGFTSHIIQAANGEISKWITSMKTRLIFKVSAFFKLRFCTPGKCRLKWNIVVMQCPFSLCPLFLFTFTTFQKHWSDLDKTYQKTSSQHPLPMLCFWGLSDNKDGYTGFWLTEIFSTSSPQLQNQFWRNLKEYKILNIVY